MPQATLDATCDHYSLTFRTSGGLELRGDCRLTTDCGAPAPGHELHLERLSSQAVSFWQTVENHHATPLALQAPVLFDGIMKTASDGWQVAHSELFKVERYFAGYTCFTGGLFTPLATAEGTYGLSEDWAFPGLFLTHPEHGTLLMAVLSQERCKPVWTLAQTAEGVAMRAIDHFHGIPHLPVAPGATFTSERWVMLSVSGGIEAAVQAYYELLRQRYQFVGQDSILRDAIVWGSWNYNTGNRSFCDITHDSIVANARSLKQLVPDRPAFVMIDDGYQRGRSQVTDLSTHFASALEIFHDDGQPPHDPALFPQGMAAIAADIRQTGALPALWATPRMLASASAPQDHPDWLLKLSHNRTFGQRTAYFDYSLPEVRDYTRNAWRTIFQEWGFQALKLDFWTLQFEIPYVTYRHQDKTAIELRNLFLSDLREFVPEDGYVLTAVVVNSGGNPFAGRWLDSTRMSADIGKGEYDEAELAARIMTTAAPFYRHDCLLADPDSIGRCPTNTISQDRLWATAALLSGAVCEIAGDLDHLDDESRHLLRTIIDNFGPSLRTSANLDHGGIANAPAVHLRQERLGATYEAWCNWSAYPREVHITPAGRDLWTGQELSGRHLIPPHDVVLIKR